MLNNNNDTLCQPQPQQQHKPRSSKAQMLISSFFSDPPKFNNHNNHCHSSNTTSTTTTTVTTTTTSIHSKKKRKTTTQHNNKEQQSPPLVQQQQLKELKVTTYNTYWFFDNENNSPSFEKNIRPLQEKARDVAQIVAEIQPHILCLQEVKNDVVLNALANALKKNYKLNYRTYWSGLSSKRTGQSIGLLIRDDPKLVVEEYGTFRYEEDPGALAFLNESAIFKELPESARNEFLNKTIWVKLSIENYKLLLFTVHLKASNDQTAKMIRELEAALLQRELKNLLDSEPERRHVILAGDFNDHDPEVPAKLNGEVTCTATTTVLERIKNFKDYDMKGMQLYNTLADCAEQNDLTSTVMPLLIDMILISDELKPLLNKVFIHKSWPPGVNPQALGDVEKMINEGVLVSDHWPVTAILKLAKKE